MSKKELEEWEKALAESDIKYDTDEEYEEALFNLTGFFETLIEMDKQQKESKNTKLPESKKEIS